MLNFIPNSLRAVRVAIFTAIAFIGTPSSRPKRMVKILRILGPSFIKLGQALSVRPDVVGEAFATELEQLQDNVPPFSIKKAKRIVEKSLDAPVAHLFKSFDPNSVAAASIAQVHHAVMHDGTEVAVKILRPNIRQAFNRDLELFYFIAKFLNRFESLKRLRLPKVIDLFEQSIRKELDLRMEAAAASELKENCANDPGYYVPRVYWQFTSESVLTLEWVNGIPIDDKEKLRSAGHDIVAISENLTLSFLNQTFRDGFFHADTHPGNLFVNEHGAIVPVDFGIMGRMDRANRIFVFEILKGFVEKDYMHVAKVHFKAGYVPLEESVEDFSQACRAIGEPILGLAVEQISVAKLLALLFKITEDFNMPTQPQLLLMQKTLMLAEGVGFNLNPNLNMWKVAEPWIKNWAAEFMSPKAHLKENWNEICELLQGMPEKLKRIDRYLDETLPATYSVET